MDFAGIVALNIVMVFGMHPLGHSMETKCGEDFLREAVSTNSPDSPVELCCAELRGRVCTPIIP
jgi:hypothetical protein